MHPHRLFNLVSDLRIDHVTAVPEFYSLLARLRDPSIDLSSLKVFVSGGSSLAPENYEEIRRTFSVDVLHGYGLSEFTPVSGNMRGALAPEPSGRCVVKWNAGSDSPGVDGTGEIFIRAPRMGATYYCRPSESREAMSGDWFRTGDLGRFDREHLVFEHELKNTRKVNGNMVDLQEVARALQLASGTTEVLVHTRQNELCANIGFARKVDFDERVKQIKNALRGSIAGYKIPRSVAAL